MLSNRLRVRERFYHISAVFIGAPFCARFGGDSVYLQKSHTRNPAAFTTYEKLCCRHGQQSQPLHPTAVFCAGGHDVDTCCIDAAVTENIRKLCNVFFHTIKCPGKKLPQIMREHLVRNYFYLRT